MWKVSRKGIRLIEDIRSPALAVRLTRHTTIQFPSPWSPAHPDQHRPRTLREVTEGRGDRRGRPSARSRKLGRSSSDPRRAQALPGRLPGLRGPQAAALLEAAGEEGPAGEAAAAGQHADRQGAQAGSVRPSAAASRRRSPMESEMWRPRA